MKKIKFLSTFILLFLVFSNQVFADIIIRKDDPYGPGTAPNVLSPTMSTYSLSTSSLITSRQSTYYPVSADIIGSDLIVDFSSSVGTAYLSVVDKSGNVVYQTVVDTFSTSEVIIPVDGLSTGKYSLKISYGSTKLAGSFQL